MSGGTIRLLGFLLGAIMLINFIVIDIMSAYNIILGRPLLYRLQIISFILH